MSPEFLACFLVAVVIPAGVWHGQTTPSAADLWQLTRAFLYASAFWSVAVFRPARCPVLTLQSGTLDYGDV